MLMSVDMTLAVFGSRHWIILYICTVGVSVQVLNESIGPWERFVNEFESEH